MVPCAVCAYISRLFCLIPTSFCLCPQLLFFCCLFPAIFRYSWKMEEEKKFVFSVWSLVCGLCSLSLLWWHAHPAWGTAQARPAQPPCLRGDPVPWELIQGHSFISIAPFGACSHSNLNFFTCVGLSNSCLWDFSASPFLSIRGTWLPLPA